MTQPSNPPRRPRLNRLQVLTAAVALADRAGIDGLTMRTLSQELGVVPMALYKHVANKSELVDGMIDIVWDEVDLPTIGEGWRLPLRSRSISLRRALLRHRWAIGLMESSSNPGPANLRQHNAMMGCLRRAGFSFRNTVHVTSALDAYLYGFTLQERSLPFATAEESGEVAAEKLEAQPDLEAAALAYPYLIEVVMELGQRGYDYDSEFETGLDLLLDGIDQLRPAWSSSDT